MQRLHTLIAPWGPALQLNHTHLSVSNRVAVFLGTAHPAHLPALPCAHILCSRLLQAFAEGGGGRKAAATRALADAQLAAKQAASSTATKDGEVVEKKKEGGADPRLQPPDRSKEGPIFKPGTSTWNTDDPKQVCGRGPCACGCKSAIDSGSEMGQKGLCACASLHVCVRAQLQGF